MARTPEKTDGAFRTIREVADWLGVPTHVLRFWESKFEQIAPVKGAGGRRYYRPDDMRLLGGIKVMLHDQGLPIRGVVQRIDDEGVEAVMMLSPDLETPDAGTASKTRRVIRSKETSEPAQVVPFERAPGRSQISRGSPPEPELPGDLPNPSENSPAQPDDPSGPLPGDDIVPPQPDDAPVREPEAAPPQPDAPGDTEVAEPNAPPEPADDRQDERPAGPAPVEPDPAAEAQPARPALARVSTQNRRALRRVIRKLRGLIEEVEDDLRDAPDR